MLQKQCDVISFRTVSCIKHNILQQFMKDTLPSHTHNKEDLIYENRLSCHSSEDEFLLTLSVIRHTQKTLVMMLVCSRIGVPVLILLFAYLMSFRSVSGAILQKQRKLPTFIGKPNPISVSKPKKTLPALSDTMHKPSSPPKRNASQCPPLKCPPLIIPKCPDPIILKPECPKPVVQIYTEKEERKKEECVVVKKIKPFPPLSFSSPGCPSKKCLNTFNMYYKDLEPYSGQMFREILQETIVHCCWEKNIDPKITFVPTSNLSSTINHSLHDKKPCAHFIFPALGNRQSTRVHGHFFIPIFNLPGAFYVTRKHGIDIAQLIEQCVELWPLLLMCVVMATIAGFIAWLCETRKNTDEFPREFFRGWFEGTWWSFISMTTVGYGDKTPRSIAGRFFSVAWILAGIIVFNILAGELTSVIMQAKMVGLVSMAEQKVGTLDRTYENSLVLNNGGGLVPTSTHNSNDTKRFYELIKNLKNGSIDGFLIDRYAYRYFKDKTLSHIGDRKIVNFFLSKTMISDIPNSGEDLSYGILIKYEERYDYFKPMFESNRLFIQAIISKYVNQAVRNSSSQEESETKSGGKYIDAFADLELGHFFIPVAGIVFFGILFEITRRSRKQAAKGMLEAETETVELAL